MMMRTPKRVLATALVLTSSLALAGCIKLGPEPPPRLLMLTAQEKVTPGDDHASSVKGVMAVFEPEVPQAINVTRVPVLSPDNSITYIKKAVWIERPARLFQNLLVETIAARNDRVVVRGEDSAIFDIEKLRGRLQTFGYDAGAGEAEVVFDAMRIDEEGNVKTRRFRHAISVVKPKPIFVGNALNEAANKVAGEVADWVSG